MRNGWARILARVGLSSGLPRVAEINDFASAVSNKCWCRYQARDNREVCSLV